MSDTRRALVETVFNDPLDPVRADAIAQRLRQLVADAPGGSSLHIAMFRMNEPWLQEDLLAAAARGVRVRLLLEAENADLLRRTTQQNTRNRQRQAGLVAGLRSGGVDVTECRHGCIGGPWLAGDPHPAVNHNKFYLFSASRVAGETAAHVVAQTSGNLNDSLRDCYNDLLVVAADAGLYRAFTGYWSDLRAGVRNSDYHRRVRGDAGTEVMLFPCAEGDPVLDMLAALRPGARVRIAMSYWTPAREKLIRCLAGKLAAGSDVRVVISSNKYTSAPMAQSLRAHGIPHADTDNMHAKFWLIEQGADRVVTTGVHNFTRSSLRKNDELLLRVTDAGTFTAYLTQWQRLWRRGRVVVAAPKCAGGDR